MDETMIYFTVSEIHIASARHLLEEAGIESFVINKKDTAYAGIIGDIELHVRLEDKEKATQILMDNGILDTDD